MRIKLRDNARMVRWAYYSYVQTDLLLNSAYSFVAAEEELAAWEIAYTAYTAFGVDVRDTSRAAPE
jgi:hypothetical protein